MPPAENSQTRGKTSRNSSVGTALTWGLILITLGLFAWLLPEGRWQGDEYGYAAMIRDHGTAGVISRLTSWSPRPVGELLNILYFRLVILRNSPLIAACLGGLWIGALAVIFLAGRIAGEKRPLLLAALLLTLSLLLCAPAEMFWWPQAALSYVPAWAGLAAMSVLAARPAGHKPLPVMAALLLAAWSQEGGAITVFLFAAPACLLFLRTDRKMTAALAAATLGATYVLLTNATHRMGSKGEIFDPASGLAGHWLASARASVPTFLHELLTVQDLAPLAGPVTAFLLLAAFPGLRLRTHRTALAWMWAAALMLGAWSTIILTNYEFGQVCCVRHGNLRQTQMLLALAALRATAPAAAGSLRRTAATLAVLSLLLTLRWPAIRHDIAIRNRVISDLTQTWSALHDNSTAMTLLSAPPGKITFTSSLPEGHFTRSNAPWWAKGALDWFRKDQIEFRNDPGAPDR
ncbi:hypothetical protein LOC54_02865 [Acetobacter sp. AN02]|uniref:hypothetical protein n=1 Tax=Acetobacter sp. AN02 TaxID=2894186 RepID=UPI0024341F07|nr:hypothetical protein [Acetobacter sp. AN02]MDG6094065.1 hypothetical protein [Acetobacter sp. AN02]